MVDVFKEMLDEARSYLEVGHPYWCDHFSRSTDQEFEKFLNNNG